MGRQVDKNAEGYGKPPPGSKSEERAKKANAWVEKEIEKLINVISQNGTQV